MDKQEEQLRLFTEYTPLRLELDALIEQVKLEKMQDSATLGPFQDVWDAWDEVHERVMKQPETHFVATILSQLEEAEAEPRATRAKEVIDIISVSLNWLRWLGYDPERIAQDVRARAALRYAGRAESIFEKYKGILDAEDIV